MSPIRIALHYAEELDQTTRNELEQLIISLQNQLPNASLFTTGTLDPDVLPPGTIGGPPAPHAPTHEPGGSDPMTVNAVPTVGSLRTLGTGPHEAAPGNDPRFAAGADLDYLGAYAPGTYNDGDIVVGSDGIAYLCVKDGTTTPPEAWPGAQTPVLHHATHEPGGTDALVNAAWTNLANTFTTGPQRLSMGAPVVLLTDLAAAVDARTFRVWNSGGTILVDAVNDAVSVLQARPLVLDRLGNATVGNNLTAGGSGGNVACKDQANVFSADQRIDKSNPFLRLVDTSQPADARKFRIYNGAQQIVFDASLDNESAVTNVMALNRQGDVTIGRHLGLIGGGISFPATQIPSASPNILDDYEEGTWTPTDASGAGLVLSGALGSYTKVGRQVTVSLELTYPATANGAAAKIGGLPFVCGARHGALAPGYCPLTSVTRVLVRQTTATIEPFSGASNTLNNAMSGQGFICSGTYEAAN